MGIVERIQFLCEKNNIKIRPLEEHLNFANGSIKRWDISSPSCDRALKVANYFDVSVDWLITGNEYSTKLRVDEIKLLSLYNELDQDDQLEVQDIILLKIKRKNIKKEAPQLSLSESSSESL